MFASRVVRLAILSAAGVAAPLVSLAPSLGLSPAVARAADARPLAPLQPQEIHPEKGIDFWNPTAVKSLVEEALKPSDKQPAAAKTLFARGVGHFDDFIPGAGDFEEQEPDANYHRFTFHDGRVTLCESIDGTGKRAGYQTIGHDRRGAPRATAMFVADGKAAFYKYAQYDERGRLGKIYTFGPEFELRFFEEFDYRGEALDIRRMDRDRKLQFVTIYEDGGVFLVMDDTKRKVNEMDRDDAVRGPVKFGLKPYYPGYEVAIEENAKPNDNANGPVR